MNDELMPTIQQLTNSLNQLAEAIPVLMEEISEIKRSLAKARLSDDSQWVTTKELAEIWDCSPDTVTRKINEGQLSLYNKKTGKGHYVVVGGTTQRKRYKFHHANIRADFYV